MWFVILAAPRPIGLKAERVKHGVRKQKTQVGKGISCSPTGSAVGCSSRGCAHSLDVVSFLWKRRIGVGGEGSTSLGTAKRFLPGKKSRKRHFVFLRASRKNIWWHVWITRASMCTEGICREIFTGDVSFLWVSNLVCGNEDVSLVVVLPYSDEKILKWGSFHAFGKANE